MRHWRDWLKGGVGKALAAVVAVAAVGSAVYAIVAFIQNGTPDSAHYSTYICTDTGRTFHHRNQLGERHPILSPHSGKHTGVIAEACYWTSDGGIKEEPTWVLLNEAAGKAGPTFCPDCGRLVVGRNPQPQAGMKAPPTQADYAAGKTSGGMATLRGREDH